MHLRKEEISLSEDRNIIEDIRKYRSKGRTIYFLDETQGSVVVKYGYFDKIS